MQSWQDFVVQRSHSSTTARVVFDLRLIAIVVMALFGIIKHGHRYNGDQAARRLHMLYSIGLCVHSFGASSKAVRLFTTSLQNQKSLVKRALFTFSSIFKGLSAT